MCEAFVFADAVQMIIIDIFIYAFIAWYIDAVFPGTYGVPKKWYFFIQKDYWIPSSFSRSHRLTNGAYSRVNVNDGLSDIVIDEASQDGSVPVGAVVGIRLTHLSKV